MLEQPPRPVRLDSRDLRIAQPLIAEDADRPRHPVRHESWNIRDSQELLIEEDFFDMLEPRQRLLSAEIENASEREKRHYLSLNEHRVLAEDPRGRALEPDYEIDADSEEFLCAEEGTIFSTKMENIDKVRIIDALSRKVFKHK